VAIADRAHADNCDAKHVPTSFQKQTGNYPQITQISQIKSEKKNKKKGNFSPLFFAVFFNP
jgi:hypothetical protein